MAVRQLHLLYHRINRLHPDPWTLCVSPENFDEQLQVVARLSPRPVITFDDGYADNLLQALPLLEKHDVAARIFVVSSAVDATAEMWWDQLERLFLPGDPDGYDQAFQSVRALPFDLKQAGLDEMFASRNVSRELRADRRMLTSEELCKLAASPLIEIGAHTVTHPVLSSLERDRQRDEIFLSKHTLEAIIDQRLQGFSYPNGMACDYNRTSCELVREAGFTYAYSAYEHQLPDLFQLPRVMIRDWNGDLFDQVLDQAGRA